MGSIPMVPFKMECSLVVGLFPYEERIDGSNPSTPIIYRGVAEEIRRRTSNPQIVGSSPTVPIIINQGGVA